MVRDDVRVTLAELPLFRGLPPGELTEVAAELEEQHYMRGNRVLIEGMRGLDFFLIVDGGAAVETHDTPVLPLGRGDFFGEIAAFDGGRRTATVRATSPLRCLTLRQGTLSSFLAAHPRVAVNMLEGVTRRFRMAATRQGV